MMRLLKGSFENRKSMEEVGGGSRGGGGSGQEGSGGSGREGGDSGGGSGNGVGEAVLKLGAPNSPKATSAIQQPASKAKANKQKNKKKTNAVCIYRLYK